MSSLAKEIAQCIEKLESTSQRIEIAHISVVELKNWQARAAALEQQPEPWIPVSERLPEVDGAVEFYSDDLRNPTCHVIGYYKDGKWFFAGKEFVNVTHWKPATAAPKEQSDE